MRFFSLKGFLAQRHAVKQALIVEPVVVPIDEKKELSNIEYVCAHYTMMGLSFFVKFKDGTILQKKIQPTAKAVAEMFAAIGE